MREIIRATAWNGFRELVDEFSGAPDDLLAAAHIEPAALNNPDRYLPVRRLIDTLHIAAERLGRPDFGLLLGSRQDVSILGALAIALVNAPTARGGLDVAVRFLHTYNPASSISIAPMPRSTRDFIGLVSTLKDAPKSEQYFERGGAFMLRVLQQVCGPDLRVKEVWFTHARVSPLAVYRRLFGVTPQFEKPMMGMAVDRAVLDTLQPGRSPQLREIAEAFLRMQGPPRDDEFSTRVFSILRGMQPTGGSSAAEAAQILGVHERTLQRRLKSEGATFGTIRDNVRRDRAESLLAQDNVSISQIAFMLNYADLSAFSRSSRRWFGKSPTAYRAELMKRSIQPVKRSPRTRPP